MLADASAKALYNTDIVIDAPVAVQDKNHGICTGRRLDMGTKLQLWIITMAGREE